MIIQFLKHATNLFRTMLKCSARNWMFCCSKIASGLRSFAYWRIRYICVCVCVFCMVQHRTEAMHLRVHVRPTWEFQSYPGIICLYIRRPVCRSMLQHSETCNHWYYMCTGECVLCIPKYKQEKSNMWPFATRRNSI